MKLASQYTASITYFEQAQKDLRKVFSDCNFERDCFEDKASDHIRDNLCIDYQQYQFVSDKECNRAGQGVMDLILGDVEIAVPIRNTAQNKHNDRMYELEKRRLANEERDREDREARELERYWIEKRREYRERDEREERERNERYERRARDRNRIDNLIRACAIEHTRHTAEYNACVLRARATK